jgi:AcrR family transcriptional regulator
LYRTFVWYKRLSKQMADTKDLILDAAEKLFAEHGFDGTSLRQITTAANVNLAAVNYHFQSKEALITAVFARRMRPISTARLEALDRLESEAKGQPVAIEKILEAFLAPILQHPDIRRFKPLMARMYSESEVRIRQSFLGEVAPVATRFSAALHRALPGIPLPELHWRIHFVVGIMTHMLGAEPLIRTVSGGIVDPGDFTALLPRYVVFAAAGMRAPIPMEKPTDEIPTAAPAAPQPVGTE